MIPVSAKPFDFFVSYTGEDQAWAEWIGWQLEQVGYQVRLQAWDFNAGGAFPNDMHKALQECARVIAVLTPAYMQSPFCKSEWQAAFVQDPTGEEEILVCIRVADFKPSGVLIARTYIDLVGLSESDACARLFEGVKGGRKKPDIAPPFPGAGNKSVPHFPGRPLETTVSHTSKSDGNSIGNVFHDFSESRRKLLSFLERNWLQSHKVVAVLQGFPGTGKTRLASALNTYGWITLDSIQVGAESEDQETDFLFDVVTSLEANGVERLAEELQNSEDASPLDAIAKLIRRERVLVVLDEFQRLFSKGETSPPRPWREFVERLNNASTSKGRLLLVSNRVISQDRWNEGCALANLDRLPDAEAADFLRQSLVERNLEDRIPANRFLELGRRLGGNPRAIKTLVGSLIYWQLGELVSELPERFDTGDVQLDQQLLERFERELISRSIDRLESAELRFMRWIAVNRLPVDRDYYARVETHFAEARRMRIFLIDRFLIESSVVGDVMHPLAREISVTRLRETAHDWKQAHSVAADYHMDRFLPSGRRVSRPRVASFVELRHHLFEAGRMGELAKVSERMKAFVLSRIPKPTHSKVPQSTEIIEEHIVMIELLPENKVTRGLRYHLALCLRARNRPGDSVEALRHARNAVSRNAYYAVWLLLADLEFTINGPEALKRVTAQALDSLGTGSNAFAIYHNCANLLGKDGRGDEAVVFLGEALRTPGVGCKPALAALCSRILERMGRTEEALAVLQRELDVPKGQHPGIALTRQASILVRQGRLDEAIQLVDQGIEQSGMTKLFALYLTKAEVQETVGKVEDAKRTLQEGIADKRVLDAVPLYCALAKLLANESRIEEAVALLQGAVDDRSVRYPAPLFHSTAAILEKEEKFELAAQLLRRAVNSPRLRSDHTIYLACAKMYFRARNLEKACSILTEALGNANLRERNEVIVTMAEMTYRQGFAKAAIKVLRDAVENEHDTRHLGNVYLYCAELMEKEGASDESERVLRKGIETPAISDKGVLVQALAKQLSKRQRYDEAVSLLREAVKWPGMSGVVILYQAWAKILVRSHKSDEAIEVLQRAMENKTMGNLGSLYTLCAEIMASSRRGVEAVDLLNRGIAEFPKDQSLKSLLTKLRGSEK